MEELVKETPTKRMRRKKILDAAKKLFYERSIANTTITDIAKESNTARSTIYEYYSSKEELLYDIRQEYLAEIYNFDYKVDSTKSWFEEVKRFLIMFTENLFALPRAMTFFVEYNRYLTIIGDFDDVIDIRDYHSIESLYHGYEKGLEDGTIRVKDFEKKFIAVLEAIIGIVSRFSIREKYNYRKYELGEYPFFTKKEDMRQIIMVLINSLNEE